MKSRCDLFYGSVAGGQFGIVQQDLIEYLENLLVFESFDCSKCLLYLAFLALVGDCLELTVLLPRELDH